jgi:hypothetical protein
MELPRPVPPSYRAVFVALAASATVHGVAVLAWHTSGEERLGLDEPAYTASLEPAVTVGGAPSPTASPVVPRRPRSRPKSEPRPEETVAILPAATEEVAAPAREEAVDAAPAEPPPPEVVAFAPPAAPVAAPPLPVFRPEALPAEVTINYALSSAFADGQAEYTWKRDGDRYEITGSAQATGFFTVFLEGRIDQLASGRVTAEGLRPDKFTERRGSTPEEGLVFDWESRTVQFRHGEQSRSGPLTDSTVDWLSMLFQLAQKPPTGDAMDLRVFTQRRLYQYRLLVVGAEELELPLGRVQTLHLRHEGNNASEVVDVWLGLEHHYLPVKLRYPVARNRLVVEQTATSIKAR